MSLTPWIGIFAPFALFFQQAKVVVVRIFHIFWKSRPIPSGFRIPFYKELAAQSYIISLDDYHIHEESMFHKSAGIYLPFLFKYSKLEIFLYKNVVPVFVFGGPSKTISVQYLKFTFPFEKFMRCVVENAHSQMVPEIQKNDRFRIEKIRGRSLKALSMSSSGNVSNVSISTNAPTGVNDSLLSKPTFILDAWDICHLQRGDKVLASDIDSFVYARPNKKESSYQLTETGNRLLNQAQRWLESEKWYSDRRIAWRRGFLLYGAPGNGKSSLVLEINRKLKIPVYVFDLSTMDNEEFEQRLNNLTHDPGSILFEDLDSIYEGRTNLTKTSHFGGLSFDCFINQLSGVDSIKNKLIFITTNHLSKLDPAIIRDGRMDEVVEILPLLMDEKRKLAESILDKIPELIEKILSDGYEDSTAAFENRCIRAALTHFWS